MFIEPDGSFVWVSDRDSQTPWQVDGVLYDRNGRLLYVELKGNCPSLAFYEFVATCGTSAAGCVVQLVRHAVIVDAAEFQQKWLSE
jgi:hypothetical protein